MLNANFFLIELWYRGNLQFVRELENLRHLFDFYKVVDLEIGGFPEDGDGEIFFFHKGVSTYKDLMAVFRYPHKSEIVINDKRHIGFDVMKRLLMSR